MKLSCLIVLALPFLAAATRPPEERPPHFCDPATGKGDAVSQGLCDTFILSLRMQPRFIKGKWVCQIKNLIYPLETCSPEGIPKGYNDKGEKIDADMMIPDPLPPGTVDGHGPPGCVYHKDKDGEWECLDPHGAVVGR